MYIFVVHEWLRSPWLHSCSTSLQQVNEKFLDIYSWGVLLLRQLCKHRLFQQIFNCWLWIFTFSTRLFFFRLKSRQHNNANIADCLKNIWKLIKQNKLTDSYNTKYGHTVCPTEIVPRSGLPLLSIEYVIERV